MTPVYSEQIGQMVASFGVADLVGEPELTEVAEGLDVWIADADLRFPKGRPVRVLIYPLAEGFELPYRKGDVVRVVYNHGEAVVVGHVTSASDHGGDTIVRPRAGKDVVLGRGSAEPEAVALFARLSAEVVNLKAQIDALTAWLAGPNIGTAPSGGGPVVGVVGVGGASAAVAEDTIAGGITGGEAALGVKGRPS